MVKCHQLYDRLCAICVINTYFADQYRVNSFLTGIIGSAQSARRQDGATWRHRGAAGPVRLSEARLVRGVVKRLRRKLGEDANSSVYILTGPRVSYRMPKGETQGQEEA